VSFPKYAKYKDAEVKWLGVIPEHWEILQSRRMFAVRSEPAAVSDQMLTASQKYGVLFQRDFVEMEGRRVVEVIMGTESLKHVEPDDFIISMRSFQGGLEWSRLRGSTSFHYLMLMPVKGVHPPFFAHLFKSAQYIQALRSTTDLIRDGQELRYSNFVQVDLPLVPHEEQAAIANFLDRETGKIDALVGEQRRLIELLKEKRQAVISQAVTKGLNPNVPMNDSGVEWLGLVPAHWDVARLKHATSIIIDCPHETPSYDPDGDFTVIRTADVSDGVLDLANAFRLDHLEYKRRTRRARLLPKDIVYSREGERWGHAALVPESPIYCLGQRMMQFRPSIDADAEFLMWILNSECVYRQGQLDTVGATSPHVNVETIRNFALTRPPIEEQRKIAAFLNHTVDVFDALIDESARALELLGERRTSLISAAVTGKIDVRNVALLEAKVEELAA